MKTKTNKILWVILVSVLVGFVLLYFNLVFPRFRNQEGLLETSESLTQNRRETPKESKLPTGQAERETDAKNNTILNEAEHNEESQKEEPPEEIVFPETLNLEVPFICQAPLGDWSPPFDDACEEANILMVHYYLEEKESIEPKVAVREIEDLVAFEVKTYGFYESTTSEQTAQLVRDYYGYKAEVYYDISLEDIKKELAKGNLVIVPAAGRMLGNPYYTPPGPLYHMLLIKGYAQDKFIVNDAGTKRGADYTYSYQVLEQALHDWNNGDVENGKSAMIVVEK